MITTQTTFVREINNTTRIYFEPLYQFGPGIEPSAFQFVDDCSYHSCPEHKYTDNKILCYQRPYVFLFSVFGPQFIFL